MKHECKPDKTEGRVEIPKGTRWGWRIDRARGTMMCPDRVRREVLGGGERKVKTDEKKSRDTS